MPCAKKFIEKSIFKIARKWTSSRRRNVLQIATFWLSQRREWGSYRTRGVCLSRWRQMVLWVRVAARLAPHNNKFHTKMRSSKARTLSTTAATSILTTILLLRWEPIGTGYNLYRKSSERRSRSQRITETIYSNRLAYPMTLKKKGRKNCYNIA